jgi:CHASE3 domain sensor protein
MLKKLTPHRVLAKFFIAVCVQTFTGILSYTAMDETIAANQMVTHTSQVLITLSDFERHYRSMEFGRAIALRGRNTPQLQTFLEAETQGTQEAYQRLVELTSDNEIQQGNISKLGELLPEDRTPGRFQTRIDAARNTVQEMDDEEERLLNERTARLSSKYKRAQWYLLIGKLISFLLFGWCFYEQTQEIKRRRVAENAIRQANDLMTEQLRTLTGNG